MPNEYENEPPVEPRSAPFEGVETLSTRDPLLVDAYMARVKLAADFPKVGVRETGIPELDKIVQFMPGKVYGLIGKPGSGKSALALQVARWWAGQGPTVYVLTEMTKWECMDRLVASVSHIPMWQINKEPNAAQQQRIREAAEWVNTHVDVKFVEAHGKALNWIILEVRRYAHEVGGLRGVVIDNLYGVLHADGSKGDAFSVSNKVGEIIKKIERLSMGTQVGGVDCPILVAHHSNRTAARGAEADDDQIAASNQIAMFLNTVIHIKVTRSFETSGNFDEGGIKRTLRVTKNRGGRSELDIPVRFIGEQMRFEGSGPAIPFTGPAAPDLEIERRYRERVAEIAELLPI